MQQESESEDDAIFPSPRKQDRQQLRQSILSVIAPAATPETIFALENTKTKRRRVQADTGEILTSEEVVARMQEEAVHAAGKVTAKSRKSTVTKATLAELAKAGISVASTSSATTRKAPRKKLVMNVTIADEDSTSKTTNTSKGKSGKHGRAKNA